MWHHQLFEECAQQWQSAHKSERHPYKGLSRVRFQNKKPLRNVARLRNGKSGQGEDGGLDRVEGSEGGEEGGGGSDRKARVLYNRPCSTHILQTVQF